jgi:quinoprotein glucose dehydrogenase
LGSILRIDVDRKDPGKEYAIPKDNPFAAADDDALDEIYAYGIRNIWRMAFDPETGTLWAADVGQDLWEEIDLIVAGGNYGWNLREGMHKFKEGADARDDLIEPIWEYEHTIGKSITGGHVYRGKRAPAMVGAYLYADYVTGKLWALRYDEKEKKVLANHPILGNIRPVMSFGEDSRREAYFMTDSGTIHTFRPAKTATKPAKTAKPARSVPRSE